MRFSSRLNSLQAIEAAARHGSFLGAAAELGVATATVIQLVRSFEDWVGYDVFRRRHSGSLVLADEAREALADITQGFDRLEAGLNKLRWRRSPAAASTDPGSELRSPPGS